MHTGLARPFHLNRIVAAMCRIEAEWHQLDNNFRRAVEMFRMVEFRLRAIGVPSPVLRQHQSGQGDPATFHLTTWEIKIDVSRLDHANSAGIIETRLQVAEMGSMMVHEMRHCEQSFRQGRLIATSLKNADRSARERKLASYHFPPHIVQRLLDAPPLTDRHEIAEARQWFNSFYGPGADSRDLILAAVRGLETLRRTNTPEGNAYRLTAYARYQRGLPEEHDAYLLEEDILHRYLRRYKLQYNILVSHAPVSHGVSQY
jgi:hypothetical protein